MSTLGNVLSSSNNCDTPLLPSPSGATDISLFSVSSASKQSGEIDYKLFAHFQYKERLWHPNEADPLLSKSFSMTDIATTARRTHQELFRTFSDTEQTRHSPTPSVYCEPKDLFSLTVDKKVRQNYIRGRVKTTCRALETMTCSQFDLERIGQQARKASQITAGDIPTVTVQQVEEERGRPIDQYRRNIIIFDWLLGVTPTLIQPIE